MSKQVVEFPKGRVRGDGENRGPATIIVLPIDPVRYIIPWIIPVPLRVSLLDHYGN